MRLARVPGVDTATRDQLVMSHVDLVRALAHRLRRRLPSQVELSELVSVGVLGLIDAASRYQPALGVPFDAFARRRIHGAMLDALRGLDPLPRSVRKLQRQAEDNIARLRQTLNREPETHEIAAALDVSVPQYEKMLDEIRTTEVAIARHSDDEHGLIDVVIDADNGPHVRLERRELKQQLVVALKRLPERERQVLALSYVQELTLAEIGRVLGVGESRISQIRTQAVIRLRTLLRPWVAATEAN